MKQHDVTDCGAACLLAVAGHYGHRLSISRIRQYASTDQRGTTVLGLVAAATRLGFTAKGVRGPFESLPNVPMPAIAHVVVGDGLHHFVVVFRITRQHVVVMDPGDGGVHRWTHQAFRDRWTGVLVLLVPGETFRPGNETSSAVGRFWSLVRPHRAVMLQALVGALVYTVLGLATAIYVQKVVDHVLVDGSRRLLDLLSAAMLALLAAQAYLGFSKSLLTLRTGQQIDARLILGYYTHLLRLPQRFFDTMRVGEIISRVGDAVKIRAFINDASLELLVNALVVVFSFGLMFLYAWKLAAVMLCVVPLYVLIYWLTNRMNRQSQRQLMERAAELESQLVESLHSMTTIKRFGLESFANLRTEVRFVRLLEAVYRSGWNGILSGHSSQLVSRLFTVVLLWVGAGLVLEGAVTPGELMSFYALAGHLTGPLMVLIGMNRTVQDALIAADRLFEIMDLEQEEEGSRVQLTPELVGDVRFQNVSFRHGSRALVFDNLTLTFPRGQLTAIVGESGSGKSTLLSLLQNLYPLEGGSIHIGEYDLRYLSNESLRRLVAVVPQTIDLFAGSVIDNVAVGDFEPDMQRLLSVCGMLGITEFVEALPNGFHTQLGENGVALSGGQRQRLAIARALYRQPEIMILDEATSGLDSIAEQYVQQALRELRDQNRTVLLVAHRLSTVVTADKIVVLQGGGVAEEGSHAELMRLQGAYTRLWQHQLPPAGAGADLAA